MQMPTLTALSLTGLLALAACVSEPTARVSSGSADFADLCAPCHGSSGRGDGALAAELATRPADLTGLASRSGGVFPMARVMSKIWGYSEGAAPASMMPEFGPLLEGEQVLVDVGDGIQTPTPVRLVQLADYLRTIQGK
jgi:hypothetical protein